MIRTGRYQTNVWYVKCVAFALTAEFLRSSGYRLVVDAGTAERFIINDVIIGHAELEAIAAWLELYMAEAAGD